MEYIDISVSEHISEEQLEKLQHLLSIAGADLEYKEYSYPSFDGAGRLTIKYDEQTVLKKRTRKAGPKFKTIMTNLSIGEVKELIHQKGVPYVMNELHIGRATLYRRLHYLEEQGYKEQDRFW